MSQLNVDPQEIAKFEAFAAIWWDQHSEFRPLHMINPLRLNWIDEHAGGLSGKKVLDVGCGGGILAESMARRGADVLGIDMGEAPLNVARLHAEQEGVEHIEYRQIPVEQLAEEQAGQYDVVTCMEMLEHVPNPASIIEACHKLVKPGGHVFFSTINRNPKAYLFAIIGAEYLLRYRHRRYLKNADDVPEKLGLRLPVLDKPISPSPVHLQRLGYGSGLHRPQRRLFHGTCLE